MLEWWSLGGDLLTKNPWEKLRIVVKKKMHI
jgi:hypothetical protein